MQFRWNEQSIQWFLEASAFTGFHKVLAKKISPFLEREDSLCDIGCGLGRLDLELAPHVRKLTAFDIDPEVVGILEKDAQSRSLHQLCALCADAGAFRERFDVVLMSFFGKSEKDITHCLDMCCKKMIRIVNVENKSSLYPARHRKTVKDTVSIVSRELEEQGLSFHLETPSIEFGQPFRSRQGAECFVRCHAPDIESRELENFLKEHLVGTGESDFPFYLPNEKKVGIFIIDKRG